MIVKAVEDLLLCAYTMTPMKRQSGIGQTYGLLVPESLYKLEVLRDAAAIASRRH
jgi:hypothetical protein